MVNTVTISGLTHGWNALNHLNIWVSKNAKTYFGSDKYLKAEGCVRDELVTLVSVKLGSIEGTVSDGNGSSYATTLVYQDPGLLTATCNCLVGTSQLSHSAEVEVGVEQKTGSCHHVAALLLLIAHPADSKDTAPFICGDTDTDFYYSGYLAAFKSHADLIELCAKYVPASIQREGCVEVASHRGDVNAELSEIHQSIEKVLRRKINLNHEDPIKISKALAGPLQNLVPFHKSHPEGVLMILKILYVFLGKADLEVRYEDPYHEVDDEDMRTRDFNRPMVMRHFINFILAQPDDKRVDALVRLFESYFERTNSFGCEWVQLLCKREDSEIGKAFIEVLISPAFLEILPSAYVGEVFLKRFVNSIPIERRVALLEASANSSNDKAVELMNLYIEIKEERKAITWLDARLASWIQGLKALPPLLPPTPPPTPIPVAPTPLSLPTTTTTSQIEIIDCDDSICEGIITSTTTTTVSSAAVTVPTTSDIEGGATTSHAAEKEEDIVNHTEEKKKEVDETIQQQQHEEDTQLPTTHQSVDATIFTAPNGGYGFNELVFIRAQLAKEFEKDAAVELKWIDAIMGLVGSQSAFTRACTVRPDRVAAYEVLLCHHSPVCFARFLEDTKRYAELAAFISTPSNLKRVANGFNVIGFVTKHPEGVSNVKGYIQSLLNEELPKARNSAYERCVTLLKSLRAVSPKTGDAEVARIRNKYSNRPNFMKMMRDAKF